ncbi:MAG: site-2 protease family protein [Pseudomonadota bacterium]
MQTDQLIQTIAIAAIPVLFAITLHEASHGYVARYFGDMTAHQAGRISLNPLRHIDPVGTVLLPILTLWLGGILFGWAKPVPVNFAALRDPKKNMLWVALAGPASNMVMALGWGLVAKLALLQGTYFSAPMLEMAEIGIRINLVLIALNLLPLPPLDGGRIAVSLLPHREGAVLSRLEPYGIFILIFMAMTPLLGWILSPLVRMMGSLIKFLFAM